METTSERVEGSSDDVVASLAAEVERLRGLLGPSEKGFEAVVRDAAAAEDQARKSAMDAGDLRGRLEEMSVQLSRARQEQDLLMRRIEMTPAERWADRVSRRWSMSVVPRIRRLTRRS